MKKLLLIVALFLVTSVSWAQRTITGTITDNEGTPLTGTNIQEVGTTNGTIADINGKFQITVADDASLKFSLIGYQEQTVPVGVSNVLNVTLAEGIALEEVVITAFGIKKETKELGYSVTQVNTEDLEFSNQTNPITALQGRVAGLSIVQPSGSAGAGADLLIRGISSVNPGRDNQPLIIVDGMAIDNDNFAGEVRPSEGSNSPTSEEQFAFTSRVGDIDSNNIETFNILKGAAATALYGVKAANGAIVITTKRGKAGKAKINVSHGTTFSTMKTHPEWQKTYREGWAGRPEILYTPETSTGFTKVHSSTPFHTWGPKYSDNSYEFSPTNIVDLTNDKFYDPNELFQTGINKRVNFDISGGNEKMDYFISMGTNLSNGIVPNTDYKKNSFRLNTGFQITDKIKITPSISFTNSGGQRGNAGDKSIMSSLAYFSPTFPINDYKNADGSQRNYTPWIDNPRYFAEVSNLSDRVNRWIGNVGINWNPKDWLNVAYKIQYDTYTDERNRFIPPELDVGTKVSGFIVNENIVFKGIESNLLATMAKELNEDLTSTLTIGHQVTDTKRNYYRLYGENLNIPTFNDISNTTTRDNRRTIQQQRNVGVFGELKFDYLDKLFLTLTGRNDWISTLPKENRSFFYPSVSASYILTEDLFPESDVFTFGKIRASWAQVGKGPTFAKVGHYFNVAPSFPFGSTGGFASATDADNVNIIPERTNSIEFGLDFRFLNNRLQVDYSYFQSKVSNQIFPVSYAHSTGRETITRNAGDYESKGHELLLIGKLYQTQDWNWELYYNFFKSEGTVLDLPDDVDNVTFASDGGAQLFFRVKEGDKIGTIYGYQWRKENGQRYIASNGFPIRDSGDGDGDGYVIVGNAFPDFTMSLGNNLRWKNISLDFLFEWKSGGDKYSWTRRQMIRNGSSVYTLQRDIENYVFDGVMDDPNNAGQYIKNTQQVTLDQNYYRSWTQHTSVAEVMLQDASWFKLRNIGISYLLRNQTLKDKLKINSIHFNISANNILLWTPYDGYDPEGSSYTAGSNVYGFSGRGIPLTENYSFNIKLEF